MSKERRGVAVLEVMARHPDWWKACRVMEVVKGVTEGYMMGEAIKLVWNSWVVEGHKRQHGDWVGKSLAWYGSIILPQR